MAEGQGGLLDIELHPNYANNGWVYISYSKFKLENNVKMTSTAIMRAKIKNNESLSRAQKKEQMMALKAEAKDQHNKIFTPEQLKKREEMKKNRGNKQQAK